MIGESFLFLKENFPLIYFDCYRMEKNLVDGDGIESIMLCGRICERITKLIFEIENFSYIENQFKRIQKLDNAHILPKDIKNKFNQIRMVRNDVYHKDISNQLIKHSYTRTYKKPSKVNTSNTHTFKSDSRIVKSANELDIARNLHKEVFNIAVWFYSEYGEIKSFSRPVYKIGKRPKDIDILIRLKNSLESPDFKQLLASTNKNNKIRNLLIELKGLDSKKEKDSNLVYKDYKNIKIRKPDKPYSECLGISYDDNLFMWRADYGGKELGLFNTSKEAFEAREVFLNSIPVPKLNSNGKYSDYDGISFSKINKMWTVSVKGVILGYYPSEKDALKMRDKYYKKHGLVIKDKNKNTSNESGDSKRLNKDKNKKTSTSRFNNLKSNKNKKSSKLNYGSKYKKDKNKTVKVEEGRRVSKSPKKEIKLKRKASKYKGIFYEEGLFMWAAEVEGKQLGLFSSEEEAKQKRDEYIKNKNELNK